MEEDEDLIVGKPKISKRKKNLYTKILERIFEERFDPSRLEISFTRDDLIAASEKLGLPRPRNLGDLPYTFRYRADFPESISSKAPPGMLWVFWPAGRSKYRLAPARHSDFPPSDHLAETKVPDATPGIVEMYSRDDEQALLARIRYNRLIDVFTGVTTYSLQSHWRTSVQKFGQLETDEVYVGIDKRGAQYVFPVQAKDKDDTLHVVQVAQDFEACRENFPNLVCRPVGAQFLEPNLIALLEFSGEGAEFVVASEKHYRLVPPHQVRDEDLKAYRSRPE